MAYGSEQSLTKAILVSTAAHKLRVNRISYREPFYDIEVPINTNIK